MKHGVIPFSLPYLQQDLLCLEQWHPSVDAVELDVRPPGEEDEEEAAGQEDEDGGQEAFRWAEYEALDGLE